MPLSTRARAAALATVFVFALPAGLAFSQSDEPKVGKSSSFESISHRPNVCRACSKMTAVLNSAIDTYNDNPSPANKNRMASIDHGYDICVAKCKEKPRKQTVHEKRPPSTSTVPPHEDRHQP